MKIVYAIILSACFVGAENKTEFYKPIVKDVEGWTIAVEPRLLADDNKALADKCLVALANHLQRINIFCRKKSGSRYRSFRSAWSSTTND